MRYKQNYFENMDKHDREDLIDILPIKEISIFLKRNKKFANKFAKGFRIDNIPKFRIKEIFNKILEENNQELFVFFIYDLLQRELDKIDFKIAKVNNNQIKLTSANLSKNNDLLKAIINIVLESTFKENIKLFFTTKEIKISAKLEKEIDLIVNNKKLYFKLYNEIEETLKEDFNKKISLKINEKDKIIYEKQENIRILKNKETELNKLLDKEKNEFLKLQQKSDIEKQEIFSKLDKLKLEIDAKNQKKEKIKGTLNEKDILINKLMLENQELENKFNSNKFKLMQEVREEMERKELSLHESLDEILKLCESEKINLEKLKEEYEECKFDYEWIQERFVDDINKLKEFFNKTITQEESSVSLNRQIKFNVKDEIAISEFEECLEIADFEEFLSENLVCAGIINQYKVNLSKYLISIICNKSNMLLIGYNAREIANAIAITTFNENVEIINCINSSNILSELTEKINKSEKKVILIENLIEDISENIYMPILKNIKDKIIIFSIENSDNIHLLNRSIFNYLIPIDFEFMSEMPKKNQLIGSVFDFAIFEDAENCKLDNTVKLIKFNVLGNILNFTLNKLAQTMLNLFELNEEIVNMTILQYTIYPLLKNRNKEKVFFDIYEKNKNTLSKLDEFIKYIKEMNSYDE